MNSASARASSVLPTPGRAEEQEAADRAVRVGEARARAAQRVGDRLDRLVLADDALVQALLHVDQLLDLALHQARDRDAGPLGDDLGDVLLGDLLGQHRAAARECSSREAGLLLGERRLELGDLAVLELGGALEVGVALGALELAAGPRRGCALAALIASIAPFSFCQRGASSRRSARRSSASSASIASRRAFDASSFSFFSASRSISSCVMRRSTSSISVGIESISIFSREAASSIRSIALSGRKRSAM